MRAMVLDRPGSRLRCAAVPDPKPGPGQVLLRVHACAVCRTDLHVVDGELPEPKLPLIPGHEIVGTVVEAGAGAGVRTGRPHRRAVARLGLRRLPLLPRRPRESLRPSARFTGYQIDGGYAEFAVAERGSAWRCRRLSAMPKPRRCFAPA